MDDVITGAMLADVVDPSAGVVAANSQSACLNCGVALQGKHCHNCGQKAQVHRTLGAFWHDFLHSILHFEGKIWRTLPLLFFKPGNLTRRYVHGERARFVSPLALFLFSVFLMFGAFSMLGGPIASQVQLQQNNVEAERRGIDKKIQEAKQSLQDLQEKAATTVGSVPSKTMRDLEEEIAGLEMVRGLADGIDTKDMKLGGTALKTGWKWMDDHFAAAVKNPELLAYRIQSSSYKYSWILIILSVPLMWLLFPFRRDLRMFDHAVFVTYSISFVSLLLILMALLRSIGVSPGWFLAAVPLHMYAQLKGAYTTSRKGALWRAGLLAFLAITVLFVFSLILLAMGVVG